MRSFVVLSESTTLTQKFVSKGRLGACVGQMRARLEDDGTNDVGDDVTLIELVETRLLLSKEEDSVESAGVEAASVEELFVAVAVRQFRKANSTVFKH
jgi:hypothetical protein